jgi:cytochrome c-type biogenesis protein CcmH
VTPARRSPRRSPWIAAGALGLLSVVGAAHLDAQQTYFGGGSSAVTAADSARDAELDAMTAEIASRFRCLVCRGQSVQESSSQLAREMQALIREKLGAGETPEEIEAFFIASYGDFILLKPRAQGIGLLVYALPIAMFGIAFLAALVKIRSGRTEPAVAGAGGADADRITMQSDLSEDDQSWIEAAIREEV